MTINRRLSGFALRSFDEIVEPGRRSFHRLPPNCAIVSSTRAPILRGSRPLIPNAYTMLFQVGNIGFAL